MDGDRFITFKDLSGTEHTYRLYDIQAVGVGKAQSYIRAFDFPLVVTAEEAFRVRARWMEAEKA